jgi:transcriptional regulator with XRE-family HTH domain
MSALFELGQAVRVRRSDMGLTQQNVAKLSGLSRTTVNQIENGAIQDLSIKRATRLVDALGLKMSIAQARKLAPTDSASTALQKACRVSGISYKLAIGPEVLKQALLSGEIPDAFRPHVRAVLEEAPIALLAAVAEQLSFEEHVERSAVWGQMRTMARALQSYREVWQ